MHIEKKPSTKYQMKVFMVKTDDSEELLFSKLRKAQKCDGDIRTIYLDIDSLPHEGCTRADIELWADDIDLWLTD